MDASQWTAAGQAMSLYSRLPKTGCLFIKKPNSPDRFILKAIFESIRGYPSPYE